MAGLCIVADMAILCFLTGGPLINVLLAAGGYGPGGMKDFLADSRRGIHPRALDQMNDVVKNSKVKLVHLGHWRKIKALGPAANDRKSSFMLNDKEYTVAEYFAMQAKVKGSVFQHALPKGELVYPDLPTVNIGSSKRPILIPAELVLVAGGQSRSRACTGAMTATIIKAAAVKPAERFKCIMDGDPSTGGTSIIPLLQQDLTTTDFGLHRIATKPMAVHAVLLPQAKLSYGNKKTLDPMLAGTWNHEGLEFFKCAKNDSLSPIKYGIIFVGGAAGKLDDVDKFSTILERDAKLSGVLMIRTERSRIVECR